MILKRKLLIAVVLLVSSQSVFAEEIIVNAERQFDKLTKTTVRAMFAMRIHQWSDGTPVTVYVLKDNNPIHITFCKTLLGMFPYQLRKIWDRQIFSGTGVGPIQLNTEKEMIQAIADNKGAIGYISSTADTNSHSISTVEVIK